IMRLDELPRSDNVEDRRGDGSGGFPMGRTGGIGIGTIILLGLIGWALGINPLYLIGGAEILSGLGGSREMGREIGSDAVRPHDRAIIAKTAFGSLARGVRRKFPSCVIALDLCPGAGPERVRFLTTREHPGWGSLALPGVRCSTRTPVRPPNNLRFDIRGLSWRRLMRKGVLHMGILDELLAGGQRQKEYSDFIDRYEQGHPSQGYSDQEVLKRYGEVSHAVQPDQYARAAQEALSKLSPEERAIFVKMLQDRAAARGVTLPRNVAPEPKELGEVLTDLHK